MACANIAGPTLKIKYGNETTHAHEKIVLI